MELERFVFYLFGSYLINSKRELPINLISQETFIFKDLNISKIEFKGVVFGFTCYLIDYYKNNKGNENDFFYINNSFKIENFIIDRNVYSLILDKFNNDNDLKINDLLYLFTKSINESKYKNELYIAEKYHKNFFYIDCV